MNDHEPIPPSDSLQQAMDEALRLLLGDNLEAYYVEVERHQAEAHELIDHARRVTQEAINAALDRLTFFGGDRLTFLGEAHTITQAQRETIDRELHEALAEARGEHERRVKVLIEDAKGDAE